MGALDVNTVSMSPPGCQCACPQSAVHRCRFCLGASPRGRLSLCYVDERILALISGAHVILYDTESGTQRFLTGHGGDGDGAVCMAAWAEKDALAVCQRGDRPTVAIFSPATLKKRKLLLSTLPDIQVRVWTGVPVHERADGVLLHAGGCIHRRERLPLRCAGASCNHLPRQSSTPEDRKHHPPHPSSHMLCRSVTRACASVRVGGTWRRWGCGVRVR